MENLLNINRILTPLQNKQHIVHEVVLEKDYDEVMIAFSYGEKVFSDQERCKELIEAGIERSFRGEVERPTWEQYFPIQQLLTLSVDDCNGFRGCAHRHPSKQSCCIGTDQATSGMIAGRVPKGVLRITVSTHCIVAEECCYQLQISGKEVVGDDMETL